MANPFYLKAKEAILHDMTDFDSNKAYPVKPIPFGLISPASKIRVVLHGGVEVEAYVNMLTQHFDGEARWDIDWISTDGAWRGTARLSDKDLVGQNAPLTVTADSAIKTYAHPDHYAPEALFKANWFGSSKTYVQSAKAETQADLSQIAADLAKLPKSPPWEQSPLSAMKESLLSPMEFFEKYGAASASGGADMGPLTYDDLKVAMDQISESTGKAFANSEKVMQATQEQMAKFGEVFLESVSGEVIPIGTGEIKLAHDNTPLGKLHEYKPTHDGIEATFDVTWNAEGLITGVAPTADNAPTYKKIKNKKLQDANDEEALNHASAEACMVLLESLSPDTPSLSAGNTLNIIRKIQLPNGSYVEVLLQISKKSIVPYQKEETHDH